MTEAPVGDEMVAFRIGPRDRAAIQRLIEAGEFRNRSDFLRWAVKLGLSEYEGPRARGRMNLEIEGVELQGQQNSAKARPAGRTGATRKGVGL